MPLSADNDIGAGSPRLTVALPQHPDEHRSERPVLLVVDQKLGEGATLRVAPELADPVGPLEVGEHEDVEQVGAGSRTESVQARPESAFKIVGSHSRRLRPPTVGRVSRRAWARWSRVTGVTRPCAVDCEGRWS
jgi:hypothetical protein